MLLINSLAGRLLIAATCIAATKATTWRLEDRTRRDALRAAEFDVGALPFQLGDWSGTEVEVDARLNAHVGAASIVNRVYENSSGNKVTVHLASFPGQMSLPHLPPLCYTGAGWTIANDDWRESGDDLRYRRMSVRRENESALVAYWYQLGSHVAADRAGLRQALQALRWRGESWHPLIKVMLQSAAESPSESDRTAEERLGTAIFGWIRDNS